MLPSTAGPGDLNRWIPDAAVGTGKAQEAQDSKCERRAVPGVTVFWRVD